MEEDCLGGHAVTIGVIYWNDTVHQKGDLVVFWYNWLNFGAQEASTSLECFRLTEICLMEVFRKKLPLKDWGRMWPSKGIPCSVLGISVFISSLHVPIPASWSRWYSALFYILPEPGSAAGSSVLCEVFYNNYNPHRHFPSFNFCCVFLILLFISFFLHINKVQLTAHSQSVQNWCTLTYVYSYETMTTIKRMNISITSQSLLVPLCHPSPVPRQLLICFLSPKKSKTVIHFSSSLVI